MIKFHSDLDRLDFESRRNNLRNEVIRFFHRCNRTVLIGEIAITFKLDLKRSEDFLNDLCHEPDPQIRILDNSECSKLGITCGYILTIPASVKIAGDK